MEYGAMYNLYTYVEKIDITIKKDIITWMNYVYLKIMGSFEQSLVREVIEPLIRLLGREVKVLHETGSPDYAFEPRRNQYYAKAIIERLLSRLPADCDKMIGVTDVDLCTPILTFVYGEAQLDGRVAVVSTHRLRQEFYRLPGSHEVLVRRLLTECLHELGHCFGLVHCSDFRCAMFFSSTILNIDDKQCRFCVKCQKYFSTRQREAHEQEQNIGR
jgi:archaemetzincin